MGTPEIGFWNSNTMFSVPPDAAISRAETGPLHEEIFFVALLSEPVQIPCALAKIFTRVSILVILTPVSVITEPVLFVKVVDNSLSGELDTVMVLFVIELQDGGGVSVSVMAAVAVFVGVKVGVSVTVLVNVCVAVSVMVGVGVRVNVVVKVDDGVSVGPPGVMVDVRVKVGVRVLVRVGVSVNV